PLVLIRALKSSVWTVASMSSNATGPASRVLVTPRGGVARAAFRVTTLDAAATIIPTNTSFRVLLLTVICPFGCGRGAGSHMARVAGPGRRSAERAHRHVPGRADRAPGRRGSAWRLGP